MYIDHKLFFLKGLPEVKLGLLPGMAGTYHLPKLIGYQDALDCILTGKNLKPDKAKKLGLVDLLVDLPSLESVAIRQAKALADGSLKPSVRKKSLLARILEDTTFGNTFLFKKAKESVDKNSGGFYPSPYAILKVLQDNVFKSRTIHLEDEATAFCQLASTTQSQALIGIFHSSNAVKKHDFGSPKKSVETIAVLGAGLMGAGIAQVSCDNGKLRTLLKDKDAAGVARGQKSITDSLDGKLKKRRITNYEYALTQSRLVPLHDGSDSWKKHFQSADMIIEAVFEDINVKQKVLKEMEEITPRFFDKYE